MRSGCCLLCRLRTGCWSPWCCATPSQQRCTQSHASGPGRSHQQTAVVDDLFSCQLGMKNLCNLWHRPCPSFWTDWLTQSQR